jgi:hypothetical protein
VSWSCPRWFGGRFLFYLVFGCGGKLRRFFRFHRVTVLRVRERTGAHVGDEGFEGAGRDFSDIAVAFGKLKIGDSV